MFLRELVYSPVDAFRELQQVNWSKKVILSFAEVNRISINSDNPLLALETDFTEAELFWLHSDLSQRVVQRSIKKHLSSGLAVSTSVGSYIVTNTVCKYEPLHVGDYDSGQWVDFEIGDSYLNLSFVPFGEQQRSGNLKTRLMTMLLGIADLAAVKEEIRKRKLQDPKLSYIVSKTNYEMAMTAKGSLGFGKSSKNMQWKPTREKLSEYYYVFKPIGAFLEEKPDSNRLNETLIFCYEQGITEKKARTQAIKSFLTMISQYAPVF